MFASGCVTKLPFAHAGVGCVCVCVCVCVWRCGGVEVWRCGGTKDNKRKRHGAKNNGVSNEFWCAPMQIIDTLHVSWVLCVLASLPFIRALFLSFFPPPSLFVFAKLSRTSTMGSQGPLITSAGRNHVILSKQLCIIIGMCVGHLSFFEKKTPPKHGTQLLTFLCWALTHTTHMRACVCAYTRSHTNTHTHTQTHILTHKHTHTHTHSLSLSVHACSRDCDLRWVSVFPL